MTLADTAEKTMVLTAATVYSPRRTSNANMTPAMGALNVAATPAAAPEPTNARIRVWLSLKRCPTTEPMAAPIWTMGPSRPTEPPEPMVIAEPTALTSITMGRMRPPRTAMAVITSGTPWPLASGARKCTRGPTMSPPMTGKRMT